jgi:hypothetical protein
MSREGSLDETKREKRDPPSTPLFFLCKYRFLCIDLLQCGESASTAASLSIWREGLSCQVPPPPLPA